MRLIDADEIEYFPLDEVFNRNVMIAYKERIDSMPTIDAVPVIRCKDCKKFVKEEDQTYCIDMFGQCDENGFCAWAERKEE